MAGESDTFAISRYKERGYDTPSMKMTMTALRSARSHRKGVLVKEGNNAVMTCGMLSPTMMQKAIIPPKALWETVSGELPSRSQTHTRPIVQAATNYSPSRIQGRPGRLTEMAISPDLP